MIFLPWNSQILAMNEKGTTGSCAVESDEKSSTLYPMLVGVSCAVLFSFKRLLNRTEITDEMVRGGVSLMGLLLWRVQKDKCELLDKLKNAETEIKELKTRRTEDAKANQKVVGIFASHEQRWIMEKKKLTQQIRLLVKELQVINTKREENISKLRTQLQEKDELLEEEKGKHEETVKKVEKMNQVLKRETQEHSKEIWKHKSAFIELVSTQRQLEAEMGRAVRQAEAKKQELDAVLEQKEEYVLMTQKLSMELIKTRKDLEHKDKILSAMLRKSKMDLAEKQMLLKQVKMSKSKRQQADVQTEMPESRNEKYSLRSILSRYHKSKPDVTAVPQTRSWLTNWQQSELEDEQDSSSPFSQQPITEASEELVLAADIRQLEGWVQCEAEKYASAVEERHQLEVNAFAEQLRLKDEQLEAFRWHSVSMDIELKQLQSQIEGLTHELTKLKEQNLKVEALLLDRESELHTLKEQAESESYLRTQTINHDQEVRLEEISKENTLKDTVLTVQSPDKEFEDNNTSLDIISAGEEYERKKDIQRGENVSSKTWKMDLHALGVFYKIKRLNQQLLMFERLSGKQESCENSKREDIRQFYSLMCLVNKQVNRYQSLQEKANDICKRMHENDQDASSGGSIAAKSKEETKKLEHFLEETFQLQRYIVATGQKLVEIQSKIACGFVGVQDDKFAASFDMKKFADCLRTLFREVQRGLEVRISRIVGDLEGPLAWDGMIHPRN